MYSMIHLKTLVSCGRDRARSLPLGRGFLLIPLIMVCFAFSTQMRGALPPEIPGNPDGCYPAFNTAEGCNALFNVTGGVGDTGVGWYSLFIVGNGSFDTGVGAGALALTSGAGSDSNTAVGAAAMLLNTTGDRNTAVGTDAMVFNDDGEFKDAVGAFALNNNTSGFSNNAFGDSALFNNLVAAQNTAVGDLALEHNDETGAGLGNFNTAVGALALQHNTNGDSNNAVGNAALNSNTVGLFNEAMGFLALGDNVDGGANVAIGDQALAANVHGSFNTVVGDSAGLTVQGSDNIYIGATTGVGIGVESGTIRIGFDPVPPSLITACYISGILGNGPFAGDVSINPATGQLGVGVSSERFKKDIDPMGKTSEQIYALKPVTFHYKNDTTNTAQFCLIAEEVAKVNPALIGVDKDGKPYTVRYNQINAMLLNEFLKEHQTVQQLKATTEKQQATIALQEGEIKALTASLREQAAQIQKVSAQIEMIKPAPQVIENR